MLKKTPMRTRVGGVVDAEALGRELPIPPHADPIRWQRWSTNPAHPATARGCVEVWLSNLYLVQVIVPAKPVAWRRLCIMRRNQSEIIISWSTMQKIKSEVAGPDALALEVYPRDRDIVDVAPMRHLVVFEGGPDAAGFEFVWVKGREAI